MSGEQFKRLLAVCNLSAGDMAKRLQMSHARVFYVLRWGLDHRPTIRDWIQAATGRDPGVGFSVEQVIQEANANGRAA